MSQCRQKDDLSILFFPFESIFLAEDIGRKGGLGTLMKAALPQSGKNVTFDTWIQLSSGT